MTRPLLLQTSAAALGAGPVMFALGDLLRRLVEPSGTPSAADITASVSQHPATWQVATLVALVAGALMAIGAAGLAAGASGRGARTIRVGAAMLGVGGLASIGHAVAFYVPYALYDDAGVSAATARRLDDASEHYAPLLGLIAVFIVGVMLGTIVLFVGLRRARRVPIWSVVAAVAFVAAGASSGVLAGVVGVVAAVLAFGPVVRSVGRRADATPMAAEGLVATLPE